MITIAHALGAYEGYNDSTCPWGLHLWGLMRAITIARALGLMRAITIARALGAYEGDNRIARALGAYEGDNDTSCPGGL